MRKHSSPYRAVLPGALASIVLALAVGCTTPGQAPQNCLLQHCKKPAPVLTVTVTGLVKLPGKVIIPPGGLQLRDAVTLTGGDMPAQRFGGISPAQVLVSLERPTGGYHFSLPLVTHDVAGRIYLMPGDRVRVEPASVTVVSRSMLTRSATDTTTDVEALRAVLKHDDVGIKPLAYDVPFIDQNEPTRDVTVTISAAAAAPATPRESAAAGAPAAPASVVTLQANFSRVAGRPFRAATAGAPLNAPNLLSFAYDSQSDPETTVIVLHRLLPGENHYIVLLRPESLATGTERAAVQDLLGKITVLPGDAVATGALVQLPIVLNSLVGAKYFDYANPVPTGKDCKQELSALIRPLKPLTDRLEAACKLVGSGVQAIPGTITDNLPR
jgi:hypothetical protein